MTIPLFILILSPEPPNWVDIVTLFVAGIGLAFGLFQFRDSIQQRKKEFRWKKAETASQMIDEIFDYDYSWNALRMLDYPDDTFCNEDDKPVKINRDLLFSALKDLSNPDDPELLKKYRFIRECFEALFYYLVRVEHAIKIELINFEDVKTPLNYYAGVIIRHEEKLKKYMKEIGYESVFKFMEKIQEANQTGKTA